jgi:O-antigen ligase
VLLAYFIDLIRQRPFIGYGTGYSFIEPYHAPHAQGPHNMFLRVWVDHGLWGLFSFLGLMVSSTKLCWRRRHMAGVAVMAMAWLYCMVNHNVIDEKAFLFALGISLGLAALRPVPAGSRP